MMAASKVAFLLCFVFLGTECFEFSRLLKKRDPYGGGTAYTDSCNYKVDACAAPIMARYTRMFMTPEQVLRAVYQEGFLNGFCNDFQQMTTCLRKAAEHPNCDESHRQTISLVGSLVDFGCSDRGKQMVLATAQSPCSQDVLKAEEAMNSAVFCMGMFSIGSEDTCDEVEQLESCIRGSLSSCGTSVVNLFAEVWPSFLRYVPELGSCQLTNRVDRGLLGQASGGVPLWK